MMASSPLLRFCLFSLTFSAARLQSTGYSPMFASLGESVTLPCGVPSITSCSSVSWNRPETLTKVVKEGLVTEEFAPRFSLLQDCSLKINHLELRDAHPYSCESGGLTSGVSLSILTITEEKTSDELELHCSLNTYIGYIACINRGMNTTWVTEDNKPLNGSRFTSEYVSECFTKLTIHKKLTDHRRKWKCQMSLNDTVKSSITYTTEIKDGLEEVFAAVGESVSLSCGDTSPLGVGSRVEWKMGSQPLIGDVPRDQQQTEAFHVNEDFSLGINKVSPLHAGDYQCSESVSQKVLNKIRLHTLNVTSESSPGGGNLTLTCELTCSKECEKDFSLTWSGSGPNSMQRSLIYNNNTLMKSLKVSSLSMAPGGLICSVYREGELMASKRCCTVNTLQTPVWLAWLALPLGLLLLFMSAGGLFVYFKRKRNKDAGNELLNIGMTHIYEGVENDSHEEQHQQRKPGRESATTDSFYDLLQAVS
ncbi:uncharacterized protein LOC141800594 [Halichoeres trimaculatus]|uniref:uncharacterized protein LOC141800594 n=1 Tax=Halichoeres trimaculatus TaxID=147232 RepID=UPI003D9DF2CB